MIGHYLGTLTPEQEDRVLTETFEPYLAPPPGIYARYDQRCLVDVAFAIAGGCSSSAREVYVRTPHEARHLLRWDTAFMSRDAQFVGDCYDHLCARFGSPRINNAIRNRILSNRARRTLQSRPVETAVAR